MYILVSENEIEKEKKSSGLFALRLGVQLGALIFSLFY